MHLAPVRRTGGPGREGCDTLRFHSHSEWDCGPAVLVDLAWVAGEVASMIVPRGLTTLTFPDRPLRSSSGVIIVAAARTKIVELGGRALVRAGRAALRATGAREMSVRRATVGAWR